jgi:para-nitrobenzyl esterase
MTPTLAYGLTHGTELLPRHPVDAARSGALAHLPLIIGTNSHEASMFAWTKPPMLPTTQASVNAYFARVAPEAKERVLQAYPGYPRRRALIDLGSDVMFGGPAWAFADAYSAHAPTRMYRFDHFGLSLRMLGLGATHGSEIVHVQHSYASFIGRKLHPLGRRLTPAVGARMQRAWLDFAGSHRVHDEANWPLYDVQRRRTRLILTADDVVAEDPDAVRRTAWAGVY